MSPSIFQGFINITHFKKNEISNLVTSNLDGINGNLYVLYPTEYETSIKYIGVKKQYRVRCTFIQIYR